jgi:putative ABC transport system substrate-binding protein
MRRREFIALMGASVTWPFAALAQEPGRTYRLGCLLSSPRDNPVYAVFFDELRRLGFIERQNLTVEYRAYGQHVDLILQYASELVKARADAIATTGDETVRVVQQATKTIPIAALVGDMLGSGLVTSLARPDGKPTGVSILNFELDGKRQDILIEAVPGLRLMQCLPMSITSTRSSRHCKKRRVHATSSSPFIVWAKAEEIAAAINSAQVSGAKR